MNDLYQEILDIVCRVTGIGYDEIFSSNKEQCVDARSLLINTLIDKGLTEREIVYLTKMSQQRVNKLKNNFKYRIGKWSVTNNLQLINKYLTNN